MEAYTSKHKYADAPGSPGLEWRIWAMQTLSRWNKTKQSPEEEEVDLQKHREVVEGWETTKSGKMRYREPDLA